jgi:hypothetical protein
MGRTIDTANQETTSDACETVIISMDSWRGAKTFLSLTPSEAPSLEYDQEAASLDFGEFFQRLGGARPPTDAFQTSKFTSFSAFDQITGPYKH